MDTLERNQVRLILEHLGSETLRKTAAAQKALHADHSAKGLLRSGVTVKRAIQIIDEQAATYVEQAVDQTSAVAQDVDAFNVITSCLTALFRGFEPHVEQAIKFATGGDVQRSQSVAVAGDKLFAEMRSRIFKQLEIHRFSFVRPSRGSLAAMGNGVEAVTAQPPQIPAKRNAGGKPLAAHWDAMWAAIAVNLWTGELNPKSQAELKAAMFDWFNKAEIDVGDTALTQRARQLWQAMEDAS